MPDNAVPVPNKMLPLLPMLAVPLEIMSCPLTPVIPALTVYIMENDVQCERFDFGRKTA